MFEAQCPMFDVQYWTVDIQCSMFDVHVGKVKVQCLCFDIRRSVVRASNVEVLASRFDVRV